MNIQLGMRRAVRSAIRFYHSVELFFLKNTKNRLIVFGFVTVLVLTVVVVFAVSGKADSVAQKPMDPSQSSSMQAEIEASVLALTPTPTSTPTPSPTPTPTPDPTLRKGDENERVQDLQVRLMELNYMDLDESTQFYGSVTKYAVELFQRQHDLKQDGVAGPQTLNLLYSDEAKKYTLLKGTVGSDVDSLQRQLIDLGYLDKATGYYGSETEAAVEEFQTRNNLSVDGKTGEQTLSLLYSPNAVESSTKVMAELRKANILDFLETAENQLGDPYILGNVGPNSFDCSGLVYYCLKQAGSSRARYNAAGYSQVDTWEKITSMDNLEKGDLLFFSTNGKAVGHVGIYIGNGTMIDASSSNGKVVKRSCVTNFWKKNFVVARRPW
jgi:peptidoglycan hydrolase-like protein with peptidoglycan-binding domain